MLANHRRRCLGKCVATAIAAATGIAWTGPSFAQNNTFVSPPTPTSETTIGYTGPNRVLLGSGIAALSLAYAPAFAVAVESSLAEDRNLYVPVAGPWIDLGVRPACGGRIDCALESLNKALLVTDGIFQGAGALAIVASLLVRERGALVVTAEDNDKRRVLVTPAQLGPGAYGAVALGEF
jgi:hypothetical protein